MITPPLLFSRLLGILLSNLHRLFDSVRKVRSDPVVSHFAVGAGRIIEFNDARELGTCWFMIDVIERIRSGNREFALKILKSMNSDTNHSHSLVPRFNYFVIDPFSVRGCSAD